MSDTSGITGVVETVPFDYDELRQGLEDRFRDAGYDIEPGSNTSQLVTAMTYLTSMLNVNTAVNINETLLPLANKRDNVLQDARALGYEIQHKQSFTYLLTLKLSAGDHSIPKFTEFREGTKTFYYFGEQLNFVDVPQDTEVQILVKEGVLRQSKDFPESLSITTGTVTDSSGQEVPQYFIDIPFVDVEENGIEVFLTYYDEFGTLITKEEWTRSETFIIDNDTDLTKKWVRLDNIKFKTPRIYFQLAGIGEEVRVGTIVDFNILTTSGVSGAMENPGTPTGISFDLENIEITSAELVNEGADEERVESVKENAPKFFNTANRAVTKLDYEAICDRQATVESSMVWGGDDEFPKSPGHIWFSFIPSAYSRVFTSDQFNNTYQLENSTYVDWDYTLDPIFDEAAYQAQVQASNLFLDNAFIQDGEIKSSEFNEDGQLINPGVWDVLENFKIPTLEYHNRHPIYLDFDYDISILRYTITTSNSELQETVFNTIDNFFTGTQDPVKMENFETQYFHSSLNKRIDTILTDRSGHTNDLRTRLMLTSKNVSQENTNLDYRDIYIYLAIPFENYFDNSGYLLYDVLPSIDTTDFVEFAGETGKDIYTDWSEIQDAIDNTTTQVHDKVITAPIRFKQSASVNLAADQEVVNIPNINLVPDDPTQLDQDPLPTFDFDKTLVELNGTPLTYDVDWAYDVNNKDQITLVNQTVAQNDTLTVQTDTLVGHYHLFNSFKKYILIQLYVNAEGFITSPSELQFDINTPKSYLTTTDGFYAFTEDNFYITTDGFANVIPPQGSVDTSEFYLTTTDNFYLYTSDGNYLVTEGDGSSENLQDINIIKRVSPALYKYSPIVFDYFKKNRYLNLNYNSLNFAVLQNTIPRLNTVTFNQEV